MNVGYGAITSQMFLFFVLVYEGIPYSVFTWTFTNSKQGLPSLFLLLPHNLVLTLW